MSKTNGSYTMSKGRIYNLMIADNLTIEFAKVSDATKVSGISRDEVEYGLRRVYTTEKIIRVIKDKSKNIVVARLEQKLVGFGIMEYQNDQANLNLLAVEKNFRRMKIGTQIVRWLEKVAITAGCFNIFVQARAMNTSAIVFYEKLGFIKLDKEARYYQGVEDGVIMAKMLRPIIYTYNE